MKKISAATIVGILLIILESCTYRAPSGFPHRKTASTVVKCDVMTHYQDFVPHIKCFVCDKHGIPFAGVSVTVHDSRNPDLRFITDPEGMVQFDVDPGQYRIAFEIGGMLKQFIDLTLVEGNSCRMTICLVEKPLDPRYEVITQ